MKKILFFFGTRPEAIKMAPVVHRFKNDRHFKTIVAVSAQHREMLDDVLNIFNIKPNADLNIMQKGQSLFDITTRVVQRFEGALSKFKPDMVFVHGDTTTTLGGSLASFYKKIPVAHVEAGLRTHNLYQPFPEEMNRHLTDALCTMHFAPTRNARASLHKENITKKGIVVTGNTVIDALLNTRKKNKPFKNRQLKSIIGMILKNRHQIILLTAHRRENYGEPFESTFTAIKILSQKFKEYHWIYPIHPNPNVLHKAKRILSGLINVHLIHPIEYSDMVKLMSLSRLIVTDSGGIQEEAPALGKPVLVLRNVTERPEAVKAGTVKIVGTNKNKIIREVTRLIQNKKAYTKMANAVNPYGDGKASERILQATKYYYGISRKKPKAFSS